MENHCIDVFFTFQQYPIHVLTAGSIIPDELNNILLNRTLQEEIERTDVGANPSVISTNGNYIQSLIDKHKALVEEASKNAQINSNEVFCPVPDAGQVSSHFRFYAKQGFYSYDCYEVKEDGTAIYRLMAWPNQTRKAQFELPQFEPKGLRAGNNVLPLSEFFEM